MADAVIQLRELQSRFAELQASSRDKDAELCQLRELVDAAGALQSQDVQTAKIIELSKKNRMLSLALEKERARASKLQSDLSAAKTNVKAVGSPVAAGALPPSTLEGIARSMVEKAAEAAEQAAKEAASWKDRCNQQTNKLAQLEQKVFSLEIECKKLTRALVREVGEDVPLSRVLDDGSDWKGRREQIVALKAQVQTLKAAQGLVAETKQEATARKGIAKAAGSRAAEVEGLRAELASARQEAEAAKTKAEGATSRRRILESELASLKEKVAVVLAKSRNDDQLIAALRAEVATVRQQAGHAASQPARPPVEQDDELWRELGSLRRRCGEQQAQISRYETTIQSLNDRLASAQQASLQLPGSSPQLPLLRQNSGSSAVARPTSGLSVASSGANGTPRRLSGLQTRLSQSQQPAGIDTLNCQNNDMLCDGMARLDVGNVAGNTMAGESCIASVRNAMADQELRKAEVEISRLQELVQMQHSRIAELEDELHDQRDMF